MKRQFMKKGMIEMYVAICAGMLLFTGCAGTEPNEITETERIEASEKQESNSANTSSEADDTEDVCEEPEDAAGNDSQSGVGKEDLGTMDTFADANDMMKSADLSGTAGECSDTGCAINTSPFADGASSSGDGGSINVIYSDETIFQKGTVKSDGSSYFLVVSEKEGLKDNDFVLCFGKCQADGSYLADRIIMIEFN